ncbi:uracil-DNA glycosylase family protein [Gluconobacter morbifer]|uniref:Uracil-DNA glycosylase-like domain-containing protein n=1 Tax=Gluconobacter morbifer G707 TaxID=1088869 RepID=G6XG99_9PROT|nr:hypothetical protein [Gluconobacter morbifer]EHH69207.1 hypothetical protein GMO_05140 [Gluconobacter morbifer G707]
MTLQAHSGTASTLPPPAAGTGPESSGSGPISAEILIVCLEPERAFPILADFLRDCNIVLGLPGAQQNQITGRLTSVMADLPADALPLPTDLQERSMALCAELQSMRQLRMVLTLGVTAHIAVLGACGIPLSRLDFRPGHITRLPDGLLLADGCHFPDATTPADLLTRRHQTLTDLIPEIRRALRPDA